jgi:mRNA interferase RelE/StbE
LLNDFSIAETDSFIKKIKKRDYKSLYYKITNFVYPQLRRNPFFGLNIKKLKGEFENIYRYRIGDFRLFYTIDSAKVIVFIINIDKRKDSYR